MSVEENLQRVIAANEAFNDHNWDRFFELYAKSVVFHRPESSEPLEGLQALRENFEGFATAFSDLHVKTERIFGQGDWVCQEYTLTGTHTDPLKRPGGEVIPPTNLPLRVRGCGTYKFEGGEITEEYDYRWPSRGG